MAAENKQPEVPFKKGVLLTHLKTQHLCMVSDFECTRIMPVSSLADIGAGQGKTRVVTTEEFNTEFTLKMISKNTYVEFPSKIRILIDALEALQSIKDGELAHEQADCLLLAYIGDYKVSEAFNKIKRFYA